MKADLVVKNGWVVTPQDTVQGGVAISDGKFVAIGTSDTLPDGKQVIDAKGLHILPGVIDAHVHFHRRKMRSKSASRGRSPSRSPCVISAF